ncbi:hypothetical protein [Variovorax sp. YR216]|uniref:hypothetical protein n=1 Tax=Variovorax sp. YR216 TaxID=1882828 RepID=UPI00115FEA87|nr:hypothetical protein [Variovorax sp. YR216]
MAATATDPEVISLAAQPAPPESSMYFEYLRRIEHALFPLEVTDPDEITNAESLRLAGMITIREESTCVDDDQFTYQRVVISEITLLGRTELRRQEKHSPFAWRRPRKG